MAAFAVMACHFRGAFFVDYSSLPVEQQHPCMFVFFAITRLGYEAVLIFFVLSGFLVGGKALERIHNNSFSPKDYTIDRAVRISLPLFSALIFGLIVYAIIGVNINIGTLVGNFFSLQGIFCSTYFETLWSLSYEVWFYILMGSIGCSIIYMKSKNSIWLYVSMIIMTICFLVFTKLSAYYLYIWIIGAFGFKLIGRKSRLMLYLTLFLSIIMIGILQITSGSKSDITVNGNHDSYNRVFISVAFALVFVILLVQLIQFPPRYTITKSLNTLGTKLAAFSYTLYLTHVPVLKLLQYLGAPKSAEVTFYSMGLYLCWVLIALAVAYGMYYLFERNTAKVKKWIKKKI